MLDLWIFIVLFIATILISFINKFFFMKGGIILRMNGIFPKKIGNREEHSKFAFYISYLTTIMKLVCIVYMFAIYLQQESNEIQQQIGNLK